ncbi:hypothetical protein ABIB25_001769 [Nakamurella sp. UYEF19]|uniref:type IV toxin-antitoxin system AbiEi family antitoxin domain-containing protein n=1 Tax=Nakamurella sp. UYEF19 TaxID=1756392 RepID=UPI00339464E4
MSIFEHVAGASTGLLDRRQLLAEGFSEDEIRSARAAGTLVRLYRGVYALGLQIPGARRPLEVLRIIGVAARSPSMVVSHTSAAVLHDLPLWLADPTVVHLTREPGGGSARTPGRVVDATRVESDEIVMVNGILVTSPARTLVDLCRGSAFEPAVMACDYVLHHRLASPLDLATALDRARHRPGNAAARRAIAFADGRSESPGESRTRVLIHGLGLPAPQLQIEVSDRFGNAVGRTDLGYVEDSALIEFDGKVKYGRLLQPGEDPSDVVVREKEREDAIRAVGTSVMRIVWSELNRPLMLERRIELTRLQGRALRDAGATSGRLRARRPIRVEPAPSSPAGDANPTNTR